MNPDPVYYAQGGDVRPAPWEIMGETKAGRPLVYNQGEDSLSSEITTTVEDPRNPGRWVNIPSIFGGRPVPADQSLRILQKNGFIDPESGVDRGVSYRTAKDAESAARARSKSLDSDPNVEAAFDALRSGAWREVPSEHAQGGPSRAAGPVAGPGGGQDDLIPAYLADGEHVLDADVVSAIGDGSTDEGHRRVEAMKRKIRGQKRGASAGNIPPKVKGLSAYFGKAA